MVNTILKLIQMEYPIVAVVEIIICAISLIIKAVRNKNALNIIDEQKTEDNGVVKNKKKRKIRPCYIALIITFACYLVLRLLVHLLFGDIITMDGSDAKIITSYTLVCIMSYTNAATVIGIPITLFYVCMSKIIEQKVQRDNCNISLFEDELEGDNK